MSDRPTSTVWRTLASWPREGLISCVIGKRQGEHRRLLHLQRREGTDHDVERDEVASFSNRLADVVAFTESETAADL